jgi:hypothetical protein
MRATLGFTLAAAVLVACRSDVTALDDTEAVERDSNLAQQVLLAKGDSSAPVRVVETTAEERALNAAPLEPLAPANPAPAVKTDAPKKSAEAARPKPPAQIAIVRPSAKPIAAATREPARRATATLAAGTELTLAANQRICVNTNEVGDRFTARLTRNVRTAKGAIIPRGTRATAVVSSVTGRLGEEALDIAVRSIAAGGTTHSISSRVTDFELDRKPGSDRCIPEGGRIVARLTRPLDISL